jgi:hypothetical protein
MIRTSSGGTSENLLPKLSDGFSRIRHITFREHSLFAVQAQPVLHAPQWVL